MLRGNGFEVEDLVELCAGADAATTYGDFAPPKWARRWPAEWIWNARRADVPVGQRMISESSSALVETVGSRLRVHEQHDERRARRDHEHVRAR